MPAAKKSSRRPATRRKKTPDEVAVALREVQAELPEPLLPPPAGKLNRDQDKIVRRERMRAALVMRRKGLSYEEIATALQVGVKTARSLVTSAIYRASQSDPEDVAFVRQLELDRLDMMLAPLMDLIASKRSSPEVLNAAVDRVLKLQERRAKYLGLDQSEQAKKVNGGVAGAIEQARHALLPAFRGATKEDLLRIRAVLVEAKERELLQQKVADDRARTEEPDPPAAG